ncbi:MAG: T9SS type A sorting domain-containing protein, partial [Chitinophagales bacterium]
RSPFNQHQFVGGNYFMVNLMKQNKQALNISAPDVDFDSTLTETMRMLRESALSVHLYLDSITTDTAFLRFRIMNKSGHKFPSGYPSRRAVVQLVMLNSNNDSLFQSGIFDGNYEVKNIDPVFEPHFNVINQSSQSEIYEMIMGDVNGDITTVLLRADTVLKDNRIPPEGFVTDYYDYDTIKIVGEAENDPDFNKNGNTEGTGRDEVHYHIPINGAASPLNVYARVFYQSVPPRWVQNMFTFDSAPIDTFKNMFDAADRKPLMIAADSLLEIAVPTSVMNISSENSLRLLHSLSTGSITLQNEKRLMIYDVTILGANGEVVSEIRFNSNSEMIDAALPKQTGIYLIRVKTNAGNFVFKAVRT